MSLPVRIASIDASDVPAQLYITGITTPAASNPLVLSRVADVNGFPSWESGAWGVEKSGGWWQLGNGSTYLAAKTGGDTETPIGLTSWSVTPGVGQPVIQGRPAPPVSVAF